jgi:phosphoglycolate phosphatase
VAGVETVPSLTARFPLGAAVLSSSTLSFVYNLRFCGGIKIRLICSGLMGAENHKICRSMRDKEATILFDFDGTIAETMMLIFKVFNRLAGTYGYRSLSETEIESVRHLNIHEFIEYTGISRWKVPFVAIHARRLMHHDIHEIHPPEGLVEALTCIHDSAQYHLDILTSNRPRNVHAFLAQHKIDWFDEIHATRAIFSKKRRVQKYIREKKIDPKLLYYVGDTTIDVESARLAGVRSVAVSWGLNTPEALARSQPDYLIHHPSELLQIFPCS